MIPEFSDSETSSLHIEFDPEVKYPDINQVNAIIPGHLTKD